MNRSVLYSVIIVVLMSITANRAAGQPEMWFPNPAYMIWEQPCLDRYGIWISGTLDHHPTFPLNYLLLGDRHEHSCYVNPFNAEKQTIYGVAFSLCNLDDYNLGRPSPIDRRVSFDILIYNFTSGDSNVQLVKRQSFVVEPNQSPDLTMLYNSLFHVRNPELEDPDSIIRIPMYEFYFDSPVDLYGDFYVGIHSLDTFEVVGAVIGNGGQILNQDMQDSSVCCPSGYLGYVDVVDPNQNDIAIVLDVDTKYSPRLKLYSLRRGLIHDCKMNKKKYQRLTEAQKLERGDVIRLLKWSRKPKVHWNGTDWVPNMPMEMELWIDNIERINDVWGDDEE